MLPGRALTRDIWIHLHSINNRADIMTVVSIYHYIIRKGLRLSRLQHAVSIIVKSEVFETGGVRLRLVY